MERIKKALDLARAQRADGVTDAGALRSAPFRRAPAEQAEPSPTVRTRTVEVDAAVIRRSRVLDPRSLESVAEAFRILRTQVLQRMSQEGFRSLAIVSPGQHDGRTLTAINLGIAIAESSDHTALIVDMDLRRPSVHRRFGIPVEHGIEECLHGRAEISDVLVQPQGYPKLVLLPGAAAVTQSSELLASERARQLIDEIVQRYANRIVIFDLPPLLATDDALALLPRVDAALLVACEGRTRREDIARCLDLMRNTPVIGTVLNGSRESATA
jgi:Mrp family chromosome partitioning ATPase